MPRYTIALSHGKASINGLADSEARVLVALLESYRDIRVNRTSGGVRISAKGGVNYRQVEDLLEHAGIRRSPVRVERHHGRQAVRTAH